MVTARTSIKLCHASALLAGIQVFEKKQPCELCLTSNYF